MIYLNYTYLQMNRVINYIRNLGVKKYETKQQVLVISKKAHIQI